MVVGLGRFGAYVRWGKSTFASLAKGDDPCKVLEALSHGLANKLLHGPTRYLSQADDEHKAEVGQLVHQLFNLPRQG